MIRILERIGIHPVAKFKRNRSDWDEFFRLLLAILSSLKGYEANRGMGARRGTAGSGLSLWAEGFSLRAKAGDKNETDMHNTGDNILNSDQRVSIGIDLFGKPVELSKSGIKQQYRKACKSEPWI